MRSEGTERKRRDQLMGAVEVGDQGLERALGWRLAMASAGSALVLDLMATVAGATGVTGRDLAAQLLLQAGWWLMLGVILYGLRQRTRWSAWLTLAIGMPAAPLLLLSTRAVTLGDAAMSNTPPEVALTLLESLAMVTAVLGAWMILRRRTAAGRKS